jgi:hypothetical protein
LYDGVAEVGSLSEKLPEKTNFSDTLPSRGQDLEFGKILKTHTREQPKPKPGTKPVAPKALTEEEPYGKNPPLPQVVMDALTLLKNLAEGENNMYTVEQLREVQEKLKDKRPQWAKCLTLQHLEEVSDKATEELINNMMDKPRWQKSIFVTAMHLDTTCDFKEFEINQKPGRDMWNPPQPKLYRNPSAARITEEWLDTLLNNQKCRESTAAQRDKTIGKRMRGFFRHPR